MRYSLTISGFILAALLGLTMTPYAQESQKSYSKKLSKEMSPTNELLLDADAEKDKNPGEALNKVKLALANSIADKDIYQEARCYLLLGDINLNIEEWTLAAENYGNAYARLKDRQPNSSPFVQALTGLGTSYLKLGQYDLALQYFRQLINDKMSATDEAEARLNISEVLYQQGSYTEALKEVEAAERGFKRMPKTLMLRVENQKSKIYARMKDFTRASSNYSNTLNQRSIGGANQKSEDISFQKAKEDIIDVFQKENRVDEEIALLNQSIGDNIARGNLNEVSSEKVDLGKALVAKGETSLAIREVEDAARIANETASANEQAKAFLSLADLYEKNGRSNEALRAYKKYSDAVTKVEQQVKNRSLEKADLIKKQRDIEELAKRIELDYTEETLRKETVFRQQLIIYGLSFFLLVIGVTSYFIYKNARASKIANQLLALKSLRSQMNPHFIFNALNSVNHFVAQNDERTANRFLSEFSQLMRLVLDNSQEDFIPLYKEQEIISLYLKLEHYRFRDKFEYVIDIDETINSEAIDLPPMLIQPYIENAVWHGLRYKESKGHLSVKIKKEGENLVVEIIDDGIGRSKSIELKTENQKKHHSTGLKNIRERLRIINKVYSTNYAVTIEDANPETREGTRVKLSLPLHKHAQHDA